MSIHNPPKALLDMLTSESKKTRKSAPVRGADGINDLVPIGSRNDSMFKSASGLRAKGMDFAEILAALRIANIRNEEPLGDDELVGIATSVMRYTPNFDFTEYGVSDAFALEIDGIVRYHEKLDWLVFDRTHWMQDPKGLRVQGALKAFIDAKKDRIDADLHISQDEREMLDKAIRGLRSARKTRSVMDVMKSDPTVFDNSQWGDRPNTINFLNGTLHLLSIELRPHDRKDRIMKCLTYEYDAAAECPNFDRVLADALDPEVAEYLLRLFAIALSGTGKLQKFVLIDGEGQNGKTTLVEAVANALGGYAAAMDPSSLIKSNNKSNMNNDFVRLPDVRLVRMAEINQGQVLDASVMKRATGGDVFVGRELYENLGEFKVKALPFMVANYAPVFDGADPALQRRITRVRFEKAVATSRIDPDLPEKLAKEAPGIMNRLLGALVRTDQEGLVVPTAVEQWTRELVLDSNPVAMFLEECCVRKEGTRTGSKALFSAFIVWLFNERNGSARMTQMAFNHAVERNWGIKLGRDKHGRCWKGIDLTRD